MLVPFKNRGGEHVMEMNEDILTERDRETLKRYEKNRDDSLISEERFLKLKDEIYSAYIKTEPCPNCGKDISKEADFCPNCMAEEQEKEWFYEESGQRNGPISKLKMAKLIKAEKISYGSRVWKKGYPDWTKLENTELNSYLEKVAPPPISGEYIKNTYMWALVIINILYSLIAVMAEYSSVSLSAKFSLAFVVLSIYLCRRDSQALKKVGHNTDKFRGWFWLFPVYMYLRAKYLKQSQACLIVWIIAVVLLVGISFANSDSELAPGCADKQTKDLVLEIAKEEFKEIYRKQGVFVPQVKYKLDSITTTDIDEDTGICSCQADLIVINSKTGKKATLPITYTSEESENGNVEVRVYGLMESAQKLYPAEKASKK